MSKTINLSINEDSQVLVDQYDNYFNYLRDVHKDLLKKRNKDYLCFTYLALCAATLEYSLNSLYINYCLDKFGGKDYKTFAETYISTNFKSKLHLAPVTVSEGKLKFNKEHKSLKDLECLIARRNKMLHNKNYLHDLLELKDKRGHIRFTIKDHISSINKKECLIYGAALGKLKKDLLDPFNESRLVETDLIVLIKK